MPLITTISEFKNYIAIDANTKYDTLKPYINQAEQLYIIDLLGKAFYEEFLALYLASVPPTEPVVALSADNAKLLPYIQRALAYYTQLKSIIHLASTFGDQGIRQHRGDDSDPAPRWLQEKLQFEALKNGDLHADKLLEFLEANASATVYATWFNSDANSKKKGRIVNSTAIASRHIDINESRRVFRKLYPKIIVIESRIVPKLIGQDQYDQLISQRDTGTVTANNQALIDKLEPIIAKRALYNTLPIMRVSIQQDGLWLYSDLTELRSKDFLASKADIEALRCDLKDGEELGFLADEAELKQFILDNIDDYPLIKASTVYTVQPDPGPTWTSSNDPDNKHFVV